MFSRIIKYFLILATLLYGGLFLYTLSSPYTIEKHARSFIKEKVAEKTHQKIDAIGTKYKDNKLVKISSKIFKQKIQKLKQYKEALKNKVDEKLAAVMAKMKNLDCKCRKQYASRFKIFFTAKIVSLTEATKKLEAFMTSKYMFVVKNLIHDFRVFLGSSFFVLLLMTILLFTKPKDRVVINVVAMIMLVSTLLTSYLYLFQQNWFYTILYSDFWGFFYLLYLGMIFLFLCDILLNKARVTGWIFNIIGTAVPSPSC